MSGDIFFVASTNRLVRVPVAQPDVRPGGANFIVMRDPQGNDFPRHGVYLDVVENERLVFTDAFTKAWEPSEKPFTTAVLTFEDAGSGKTKYTARVLHWTLADAAGTTVLGVCLSPASHEAGCKNGGR